jgi:hypothetical protein
LIPFISFLSLLIISSLNTNAQDTTNQEITPKSAIKIKPIQVSSFKKDTAYSFSWEIFNITSDTSKIVSSNVYLYDRRGFKISTLSTEIPPAILKNKLDIEVLKSYYLMVYPFKTRN